MGKKDFNKTGYYSKKQGFPALLHCFPNIFPVLFSGNNHLKVYMVLVLFGGCFHNSKQYENTFILKYLYLRKCPLTSSHEHWGISSVTILSLTLLPLPPIFTIKLSRNQVFTFNQVHGNQLTRWGSERPCNISLSPKQPSFWLPGSHAERCGQEVEDEAWPPWTERKRILIIWARSEP